MEERDSDVILGDAQLDVRSHAQHFGARRTANIRHATPEAGTVIWRRAQGRLGSCSHYHSTSYAAGSSNSGELFLCYIFAETDYVFLCSETAAPTPATPDRPALVQLEKWTAFYESKGLSPMDAVKKAERQLEKQRGKTSASLLARLMCNCLTQLRYCRNALQINGNGGS